MPDYGNLNDWAAHPWKKDPSDSVPKALQSTFRQDSSADVFFIYPTSLTKNGDVSWNASLDDDYINKKTDGSSILYQASVFNESCRIFAPRYRQAHLNAFLIPTDSAQKYFDIAYADIKKAFEFYLKNYNNGKPVIVAAHSQGTLHAGRLLKEFFEEKPLRSKLVCAYLIGLPVPDNYFSSIPVCSDSISTGCFVSWRTFKSGHVPDYVKIEKFKAVVVNPLTWTTAPELVKAENNMGGLLKNYEKIAPHVVSAQVHENVLWASKPDVTGKLLLFNKNYHIGDINLFYMNIRSNVRTRINSYLKSL